ncbi:hypothetical protein [Microseira sp. BLCC-F43]
MFSLFILTYLYGETFYDTGIRLPNLAEGGRRGLTTAAIEALPTQEEALN